MSPPDEPRVRPVTPFVILFEGRTGSTYLEEALDRHPEVRARKEVFASLRNQGCQAEHRVEWLEEFLGEPPEEEGGRAVGFKTKTKLRDVLDPEATARVLEEVGASAIVLLRWNRVNHLVSVFNAMRLHEETGDWNLYADGGTLPPWRSTRSGSTSGSRPGSGSGRSSRPTRRSCRFPPFGSRTRTCSSTRTPTSPGSSSS